MRYKLSNRIQTVINLATGILTMLISLAINFFLSSYIVLYWEKKQMVSHSLPITL